MTRRGSFLSRALAGACSSAIAPLRTAVAVSVAVGLLGLSACHSTPARATPSVVVAPPAGTTAPVASAAAASPPASFSARPPGAAPSDEEQRETRLVARMLKRVELARHLQAARPVPGRLLERPALIARVKEHVSRELPPQAIRNEGLALQLFGFIPTQYDYEAAEYQLLQDQLAGYYEPADGTMYMAADLGEQEAEATLAHELVHALQDQRWDLEKRSQYRPGDGDRSEAVSALAEGDATSAMFDVMIEHAAPGSGKSAVDLPDDVFAAQIREGMNQGPGAGAPRVMRTSLAAPYIYGTLFVHALRRRGGWDAVDRAWDDAPTTSEQVMHPEKWTAREPAMPVAAPAFASLGSGWTVADEDSEGELGTRIAFEEWMEPKAAGDASAGWGGDRGVLLENRDLAAFAWRLRYDPGKSKDELTRSAYAALARGLEQSVGPAKVRDGAFACRERADRGPLAVARAGTDLVFVLGPARTTASGWTSAGDCALARKWVHEIAATP
jgi:hypothetical protein